MYSLLLTFVQCFPPFSGYSFLSNSILFFMNPEKSMTWFPLKYRFNIEECPMCFCLFWGPFDHDGDITGEDCHEDDFCCCKQVAAISVILKWLFSFCFLFRIQRKFDLNRMPWKWQNLYVSIRLVNVPLIDWFLFSLTWIIELQHELERHIFRHHWLCRNMN